MTELHETRMGQTLITHTLPELVRQLERLNQNLERLADLHVQAGAPQPSDRKDPSDSHEEVQPTHD